MDSADFRGLENNFRNMDAAGVDMQVLSVSSQFPYFANENDAVDVARLGNDLFARAVSEYPKRFSAFAFTPLPHIDDLGMAGVTAGTTVFGKSIADPAF